MKRKQIDAILVDQTKRRKKIYIYICVIFNVSLIALVFFLLFLNKNKTYYVPYKEESNIDYKVFLFDNSFYKENYL